MLLPGMSVQVCGHSSVWHEEVQLSTGDEDDTTGSRAVPDDAAASL